MAKLTVEGSDLVVQLSTLEKLGGLVGNVRVPLTSVRQVRVSDRPYDELRGLRVGTGIPFVIVLGRMLHGGGADFVAVYGTGRIVVIDLEEGQRFRRLLVSGAGDDEVERIREAAAAAR